VRATHTSPKPTQRAGDISSPSSHAPMMNCRIGATNCSIPITVSGTRREPAANSRRGVAVMTPASPSRAACQGPSAPKVIPVVVPTTMSSTVATGSSHIDSSVRPLTASTDGPSFFFTRP